MYRELTREANKLEMLTLYTTNMRYWLRVKSRWFDIAWDEDEVNKKAKKAGRISSHLERTSLENKGYYYTDKKKTSSCGTDSENLRRARWAGSQSQHRIHFTLTARGFAHIVGQFIASATIPETCIKDNRPKISRKYYWRRRAQIKQLAWPMAERQIGHRKSSSVISALIPAVNWRFRSFAKSAYY